MRGYRRHVIGGPLVRFAFVRHAEATTSSYQIMFPQATREPLYHRYHLRNVGIAWEEVVLARLRKFLEYNYGIARSRRHPSIHPELANTRCSCFACYHTNTTSVTATPFPKLQKFELLTSQSCFPPGVSLSGGFLETFLIMASSRAVFPSLHTIAIYHLINPTVPIDAIITPNDHDEVYSYLLAWTNRFREVDISLVGVDDEPIAPANPDPGRWTGRNASYATAEDDDMISSEEVSYRDESSEYGASDSESDEGGWGLGVLWE